VKSRLALAALTGAAAFAFVWSQRAANAQRLEPGRPQTVIVGSPNGAQTTERVDARRTGFTRARLPKGALRVAWRHTFAQNIEHTPLVMGDSGDIAVIVGQNDLAVVGNDGNEKWRTRMDAGALGPPAMLSDGTVVAVTSGGEAVGVRRGAIRFRTRLGGDRTLASHVSPLPLDDGGVIVATATELTALDAEGGIRTRATIPDTIVAPLVAFDGQALAVTFSGNVYGWTPGKDARKIGSFGQFIDTNAAIAGKGTLVAVSGGNTQLLAFDAVRGTAVTRATAQVGFYLGPPAFRGETAYLLSLAQSRMFLLTIDGAGQEVARVSLGSAGAFGQPDSGPITAGPTTPRAGPIVDDAQTVAFATLEGQVGVASATGGVELLQDTPWLSRAPTPTRPHGSGGVIGLCPIKDGFLVASDSGTLAAVMGDGSRPPSKP
jgi:outer membrane protein assembly factor BamB